MAVTHRSLSIAVESGGFGSLDVSTGLPSSSGLTYISIPCERDPIVIAGEPIVSERNDARDGSYFVPSEPDTVYSGGNRVRRRTGSIVCRVDLTTHQITLDFCWVQDSKPRFQALQLIQ